MSDLPEFLREDEPAVQNTPRTRVRLLPTTVPASVASTTSPGASPAISPRDRTGATDVVKHGRRSGGSENSSFTAPTAGSSVETGQFTPSSTFGLGGSMAGSIHAAHSDLNILLMKDLTNSAASGTFQLNGQGATLEAHTERNGTHVTSYKRR